jgi:hypothetical protein
VKRIAFVLLLILIAVVAALWRLPASIIITVLPDSVSRQIAPHVSVHALDGTIWKGSARFSLAAVPPSLRVEWRCVPSVAPVGLNCDLGDAATGNVHVAAFENLVTLSQIKIAQPVRLFVNGLRAFDSDLLTINVSNVVLSNQRAAVSANAVAIAGVSRLRGNAAPLVLGEVSLDCAPVDNSETSRCTLRNRAGEQRIDGQIELRPNRVSGSVSTGTPAQTFTF